MINQCGLRINLRLNKKNKTNQICVLYANCHSDQMSPHNGSTNSTIKILKVKSFMNQNILLYLFRLKLSKGTCMETPNSTKNYKFLMEGMSGNYVLEGLFLPSPRGIIFLLFLVNCRLCIQTFKLFSFYLISLDDLLFCII